MFGFSDDNKRYHTLNYYNRRKFGKKLYKAAIDAGLGCPNRDGSKGNGGCIFCAGGSGYFTNRANGDIYQSVTKQISAERERILKKHPDSGITAYFQAGSNTYTDADTLRKMLCAAMSQNVDAIAIATRADCIDEERLTVLRECSLPLTVELGLQTANDDTASLINRCHSFKDFLHGYRLIKDAGIRVCVHIINGLPKEDKKDMLNTARILGQLEPDAVKIHLLHVIEGTALADIYRRGEYLPMTKEDYISIVVSQLEYLPPRCVIERLTGDGDKRTLIAPLWSRDKISVLGGIDLLMARLDTYQGRNFTKEDINANTDL